MRPGPRTAEAPERPADAVMIGERVYLRALETTDAALLRRAANDPQVRTTFFTNYPANLAQQEDVIRRLYQDRTTLLLAVCTREPDGRAVGVTGFHRIDWVGRMATFSLIIADPDAWGRGFGSEATRLMIEYGFDVLNFHRIQLHVFDGNEAAKRIYKKAGFREEGRLREAMVQNGRWHDFLVMGLLEDEWREVNRRRD
ncbi:MAG: GNAT family protein [Candidatus Sumerlaeia bacterium]